MLMSWSYSTLCMPCRSSTLLTVGMNRAYRRRSCCTSAHSVSMAGPRRDGHVSRQRIWGTEARQRCRWLVDGEVHVTVSWYFKETWRAE